MADIIKRFDMFDAKALVAAIEAGTFTTEQVEQISNSIRIGLASSLMKSVAALDSGVEQLQGLNVRLSNFVQRQIDVELENNSLSLDTAMEYLGKLVKMSCDVAEVKRRVFNGKELFTVDPLSTQDRAMMDLLKAIPADRKPELLQFLQNLTEAKDDF